MELKEFIEAVISSIIDAENSLGGKYKSKGITINPSQVDGVPSNKDIYDIDFEVVLTEIAGKSNKKKIGVYLGEIAGAGIENEKEAASTSQTKIKFQIQYTKITE